jgi:hypothetical protein
VPHPAQPLGNNQLGANQLHLPFVQPFNPAALQQLQLQHAAALQALMKQQALATWVQQGNAAHGGQSLNMQQAQPLQHFVPGGANQPQQMMMVQQQVLAALLQAVNMTPGSYGSGSSMQQAQLINKQPFRPMGREQVQQRPAAAAAAGLNPANLVHAGNMANGHRGHHMGQVQQGHAAAAGFHMADLEEAGDRPHGKHGLGMVQVSSHVHSELPKCDSE